MYQEATWLLCMNGSPGRGAAGAVRAGRRGGRPAVPSRHTLARCPRDRNPHPRQCTWAPHPPPHATRGGGPASGPPPEPVPPKSPRGPPTEPRGVGAHPAGGGPAHFPGAGFRPRGPVRGAGGVVREPAGRGSVVWVAGGGQM